MTGWSSMVRDPDYCVSAHAHARVERSATESQTADARGQPIGMGVLSRLAEYAHESEERKQAALAANPGTVGHVLGTPGWAEQKVWRQTDEKIEEEVVDGRRLELPTSALRTRRSPN